MPGLGEEFRAAREARHLSLSDVSEQIHIRSIYLKSIEEEDWGEIAAPVYVRGFIRTYARFLGLDPEASVERYNAVAGPDAGPPTPVVYGGRVAGGGPSLWVWLAGLAALILVGFVIYNFIEFQMNGRSTTGVAKPGANPPVIAADTSAPRSTSSPAAARAHSIAIVLSRKSWVRVEVDGMGQMEGTYDPGTTRTFHGKKSAEIRVGDAGAVDVKLNGKDLGPMGASGAISDKTFSLTGG